MAFEKMRSRLCRLFGILSIIVFLLGVRNYFVIRESSKIYIQDSPGSANDNQRQATGNADLPYIGKTVAPRSGVRRHYEEYTGFYLKPTGQALWVTPEGNLHEKIDGFNTAIGQLRKKVLAERTDDEWKNLNLPGLEMIDGHKENYLDVLSRVDHVTGIFLSWTNGASNETWSSLREDSNLIIQRYYPWIGSGKFCSLLAGKEHLTNHHWDIVYNKTCDVQPRLAVSPKSLEIFFLNSLQIKPEFYWPNNGEYFPPRFYQDVPQYVFYLHVFQDGLITDIGNVYTADKQVIPYNCRPVFKKSQPPKNYMDFPLYDEVFSIAQFWGQAFFHKMLEDYPKLAPYVKFLRENPSIKIQVGEVGSYTTKTIQYLELDPSRLIFGHVRAKVVYLPRGTTCGFTHIQEGQYLSHLLREAIHNFSNFSDAPRRNLILVRRSVERHLTHQTETKDKLKALAEKYNLNFFWFRDDPVPSLEETMLAFNKAVMVVGPHGAGLSNMVYSEPGTYIIEGICNPPHTNMCYTRLSHLLGNRYHALISRGGCQGHVDIPAQEIADTAEQYLQLMHENGEI